MPVASIATCVQPFSASHSDNAIRLAVVVSNVRTSLTTSPTTRQSAPLRRIGTFGLAVGAACAFSLGIAGQVLTFRTRARLSFAPPTCGGQQAARRRPAGGATA